MIWRWLRSLWCRWRYDHYKSYNSPICPNCGKLWPYRENPWRYIKTVGGIRIYEHKANRQEGNDGN